MTLPTTAAERKAIPIATGFVDYFPDAMAEVAELSKIGNDQHHPGQPLHWDRSKSQDEDDALMRHFVQRGTRDTDKVRHRTKVAWRAMAALQKEIEAERAKPVPESKFGFTIGDHVRVRNGFSTAVVEGFTKDHVLVRWRDDSRGEWVPKKLTLA